MKVRYRCRCGAEIDVEWHPFDMVEKENGETRITTWQSEHRAHIEPVSEGQAASKYIQT